MSVLSVSKLFKQLVILFMVFMFNEALGQPKISLSFDDGVTKGRAGYSLKEWNQLLLNKLKESNIESILFVKGHDKSDKNGKYLLESWDNEGHLIANHTLNHPNYSNNKISFKEFAKELIDNDSVIRWASNYAKFFRFPYLKEGNTEEKVNLFRNFMKEYGYRNGYVTIDASDWYIDSRLNKRLRENPDADLSDFRKFYLAHINERAEYYEKLSFELTGRHICHTLLLHHNLAAALFIDDLIKMFKNKGWVFISAKKAYEDPIFNQIPNYAGESLIYALAKDSGNYESLLRYPAEDSRYEKARMDELGL